VEKQPDALMTLFLFSAEELRGILGRLGYGFDADAIRETVDFYTRRVTHGSSLSRVVYAWINARLDRSSSWRYLSEALGTDLYDLDCGTTREGIHLGAMAGTIDIFERCYPGLEIREDALWLNPALPEELRSIAFRVNYRGHLLSIGVDHDAVTMESPESPASPVSVRISGEHFSVPAGEKVVHRLASTEATRD
jgi:trehalose/maltose hydrolase-like predicted phosphorylase